MFGYKNVVKKLVHEGHFLWFNKLQQGKTKSKKKVKKVKKVKQHILYA